GIWLSKPRRHRGAEGREAQTMPKLPVKQLLDEVEHRLAALARNIPEAEGERLRILDGTMQSHAQRKLANAQANLEAARIAAASRTPASLTDARILAIPGTPVNIN